MLGLVSVKTLPDAPQLHISVPNAQAQAQRTPSIRSPSPSPSGSRSNPSPARSAKKPPLESLLSPDASLDNPDLAPFLLKLAWDTIASEEGPTRALDYAVRATLSFEQWEQPNLDFAMNLHVLAVIHYSLGRFEQAVHVLEWALAVSDDKGARTEHALVAFSGYMQLGGGQDLFQKMNEVVLVVRKRPHVVNGGGFVVTDSSQKIVFRVDGCGVLGFQGELLVRDGDGDALILVRRKEGLVEALSVHRKWKGYTYDYEGSKKPVFCVKDNVLGSCLVKKNAISVSTVPRRNNSKDWDFEVRGFFPDRASTIVDHLGNVVAQIGAGKEKYDVTTRNDLYSVLVKPGVDQAFVIGVVAVLDNIYGESTSC